LFDTRRDEELEAAYNTFNGVDEDELKAYYASEQDND
jgi:hypothetical protein